MADLILHLPLIENAKNKGLANLTLVADTTYESEDRFGLCAYFNLDAQEVAFSGMFDYINTNNGITLLFNYKPTNLQGNKMIIAWRKWVGSGMYIFSSNQELKFKLGSELTTIPMTFLINTWYNIAIVSNTISTKVYINSELILEVNYINFAFSETNFCIGRDSVRNINGFVGFITDVRFYNGVLSKQEIHLNRLCLMKHLIFTEAQPAPYNLDRTRYYYNKDLGIYNCGLEDEFYMFRNVNSFINSSEFVYGKKYKLNDASSGVVGPLSPAYKPKHSFSCSVWFQPRDLVTTESYLFGIVEGGGWGVRITPDNEIGGIIYYNGYKYLNGPVIESEKIYHAVFTISETGYAKLYVNSELIDEKLLGTVSKYNPTAPYGTGNTSAAGGLSASGPFDGFQDLRVYATELSQLDVDDLYNLKASIGNVSYAHQFIESDSCKVSNAGFEAPSLIEGDVIKFTEDEVSLINIQEM